MSNAKKIQILKFIQIQDSLHSLGFCTPTFRANFFSLSRFNFVLKKGLLCRFRKFLGFYLRFLFISIVSIMF